MTSDKPDKEAQASKTAEDCFFEGCAIRIRKLNNDVKSLLQLQISQLFFNAENPKLSPQIITPLPYHTNLPSSPHDHDYISNINNGWNMARDIQENDPILTGDVVVDSMRYAQL